MLEKIETDRMKKQHELEDKMKKDLDQTQKKTTDYLLEQREKIGDLA